MNPIQAVLDRTSKQFDEEFIPYGEYRIQIDGGNSMDAKSFIRAEQLKILQATMEVIKGQLPHINVDEYLPAVKSWDKTYDSAFDAGYKRLRSDLLASLDLN